MSVMRNRFWLFVALSVALLASACGGGGGGSKESGAVTVTSVSIKIDPGLSHKALTAIASFASATQSQQPSSSTISTISGGDGTVLALGADGGMLLAARPVSGVVNLSAESTAVIATQLALDQALIPLNNSQTEGLIRTAPSFNNLVTSINASIESGQAIAKSADVVNSITSVTAEVILAYSESQSIAATPQRAFAVSRPMITTDPAGLKVLTGMVGGAFSGITVQDKSTRLKVENTTLLRWAVNTTDTDGYSASIPGSPLLISNGTRAALEPASPSTINAATGYLFGLSPSSVELNHGPTPSLGSNFVLEQTDETQAANLNSIMIDTLSAALGILPVPKGCITGIAKGIITSPIVTNSLAQGKLAFAMKKFEGLSLDDWKTAIANAQAVSSCVIDASLTNLVGILFAQYSIPIKVLINVVDKGLAYAGTTTTATKIIQYDMYPSREAKYSLGFCTAKGVLINCANVLQILPYKAEGDTDNSSPYLFLGASLPIRVQAFDVAGRQTLLPDSLSPIFSNSNFTDCLSNSDTCPPNTSNLTNYLGRNIKAFPSGLGRSTMQIVDAATTSIATPAEMSFTSVKIGSLVADKIDLLVDEVTNIKLVDPNGHTIFGNDPNLLKWESSDLSKIMVTPKYVDLIPVLATVTAKNATNGTPAFIRVRDGSGNIAAELQLNVSKQLTVSASTTPQNLTVGTPMTNFTPLTASGGKPPYIYSVTSGSLPAGLSLDSSTGAVSGTPTTSYPSADVVFSVTDANNEVANTTSTVNFTVGGVVNYTIRAGGVDDNIAITLIDAKGVSKVIFSKGFGLFGDINFQAFSGDSLHIVLSDAGSGGCYAVGGQATGTGLTLTNPSGDSQVLVAPISVCDGKVRGTAPYIFFDQTIAIGI